MSGALRVSRNIVKCLIADVGDSTCHARVVHFADHVIAGNRLRPLCRLCFRGRIRPFVHLPLWVRVMLADGPEPRSCAAHQIAVDHVTPVDAKECLAIFPCLWAVADFSPLSSAKWIVQMPCETSAPRRI